jgi:uncharacterized protein
MQYTDNIDKTILCCKGTTHPGAEGGHDWFHIERVFNSAILIASEEKCDITTVQLAALLHDIADSKFHGGDENGGPKHSSNFS